MLYDKSNSAENAATKATLNITIKAVGRALANIFNRKLPFTNSLFGSNARMNDGVPIVNVVIKVNCIGIKKYF